MITDKLLELRKSKGWSQQEMADRTGIPRPMISRYEIDTRPGKKNLHKILDALGLPHDYFFQIEVQNAHVLERPHKKTKTKKSLLTFFASNLRFLRDTRNLTIRELADIIGVSHVMITSYENKIALPRPKVAQRIADYFGIEKNTLLSTDLRSKVYRSVSIPGSSTNSSFGERLREVREFRKLSQMELADQLQTSYTIIEKYERDEMRPSIDTAISLAKALETTVGYLIGEVGFTRDQEIMSRINDINMIAEKEKELIFFALDAAINQIKLRKLGLKI